MRLHDNQESELVAADAPNAEQVEADNMDQLRPALEVSRETDARHHSVTKVLEVSIRPERFCLSLEHVDQMDELEIGPPLPLALSWMTGLAWRGGKPVVVVSPIPRSHGKLMRRTGSVVVLGGPKISGATFVWAVEIDSPGNMLDVVIGRGSVYARDERLPSWITPAKAERRSFGWIDVPNMIRAFGG